jgi:hypothetical protein
MSFDIYGKYTIVVQQNGTRSGEGTAISDMKCGQDEALETPNTFPRFKMVFSCPH